MENILLVISYIVLMISVFCIFNARGIVKKKAGVLKENKYVRILKSIGTFFVIVSLVCIIYV